MMNMRRLIFVLLPLALAVFVLDPCDQVRAQQGGSLSVSPGALSLTTGDPPTECTISGGTGPYSAVSENGVAMAAVSGSTLSVTGFSPGPDTITVSDSDSDSARVTVTVRDVPSDYYSYYVEPKKKYYCTDQPCDPREECTEDWFLCPDSLPNRKYKTLQGYKEINDLNDPILLCGKDLPSSIDCGSKETAYLSTITPSVPNLTPADPSKVKRMRFFVPKGSNGMAYRFDCYWGYAGALVARWGQPPDCERCYQIKSDTDYNNFQFASAGSLRFDDFKKRDIYQQNNGAYIPVFGGGISPVADESGWLYVYVFYRELEDLILNFQYAVDVDKSEYLDWYDECDANGDWDEDGNPPYRVGAQAGVVNQSVPLDQTMYVVLNTSNTLGDQSGDIAQEWLVYWIVKRDETSPPTKRFFRPGEGSVNFDVVDGTPEAAAYPCSEKSNYNTFQIITISLAELGLASGDQLIYGYGYSREKLERFEENDFQYPPEETSKVIFNNIVTITAE